ncbi:fibronectin type III domain-containing protein [Candidatus Woesearchaeota archaeon]|nr:fibronectin type III domain-containing protein [Candidatus Woesearchaeota archaeon]
MKRMNDLMAIFLIQLVLTLPFYTASAYGLAISDVRVAKVTSNSASIEWLTDNFSNGKVRYGKTASLGFSQRHDNFVDNHSLNIVNGIDSDTAYFFAVESSDLMGNTAVDNNSNNFHTFKTLDITPPPQVAGLQAASKTSSSILLSWDALNTSDLSYYTIYRNRIAVGNSTTNSFNDTGISSGSLSYKVSAVDTSGNEGLSSDSFMVSALPLDSAAPAISNADVLGVTDATARVTWITDENSTTIVLYGINKTDKAKSSAELVTNHSIVIDGLVKNANYTILVKSCDASGNCANLSKSFTAGKDTTLPFINLSTPRFVNRRVTDLIGSTEPFSQLTLFVNDMNIPKRSLGNAETGNSGKFAFSQVQLEQDNIIRLVAVDKSNNRNQKIFEVSVDTQEPSVQLDEVPLLTSKTNLTVKGSVNEQVLIKVFVDAKANETAVPSQITGLNATKVGQNFVELQWNELKDKDFSHYVVYREDSSPIAITKPANFNLFIDALVDSGRSYTYQISAVNIFANEGTKSEPVTATTLSGGAALGIKPKDVDIFEDFRKPLMILNWD